MSAELPLRRPNPLETLAPYASMGGVPLVWLLPYSLMTWVVALGPSIVLALFDRAWRALPSRLVTPRAKGTQVELVGRSGSVLDTFDPGDFDALTLVLRRHGGVEALRVDRRHSAPLLFSAASREEGATVAAALGLDLANARTRYRGGSLVLRLGALHALAFLIGLAFLAYMEIGHLDAADRASFRAYLAFVWIPLALLTAVPTRIDVAPDGVAWRWLFVRGYVPFTEVHMLRTGPKNLGDEKAVQVDLVGRGGRTHRLFLGPSARGALPEIRRSMNARPSGDDHAAVTAWLARREGEDVRSWIRRLQAGSSHQRAYRTLPAELLGALAENPSAPTTHRCGALLVLWATESERGRVRTIATTSADPAIVTVVQLLNEAGAEDDLVRGVERALG